MSSTRPDRPVVHTRVGRALIGDNHFRGRSVARELMGLPMASLYSIAIGGPELTPRQAMIVDAMTAAGLAADPRIWPLKVAPLVASYGSTLAGYAAAVSYFEGMMVSPMQSEAAAHALLEIHSRESSGEPLAHIISSWEGRIPGFGVPARDADERVATFKAWYAEFGSEDARPIWELVVRVHALKPKMKPNAASLSAAVALDLGLTPHQAGLLSCLYTTYSVMATAVESSRERPAPLRCLPRDTVDYQGPGPRRSPRGPHT